jgi:hypothetical protein
MWVLRCSEEFELEGLEASDLRFEELWFIYGHRTLCQAVSPSGSIKALFVSQENCFPGKKKLKETYIHNLMRLSLWVFVFVYAYSSYTV